MKFFLATSTLIIVLTSCNKETCQTCTKTIGGVAGTFVDEVREVCDSNIAHELEISSSGTTVWKCD